MDTEIHAPQYLDNPMAQTDRQADGAEGGLGRRKENEKGCHKERFRLMDVVYPRENLLPQRPSLAALDQTAAKTASDPLPLPYPPLLSVPSPPPKVRRADPRDTAGRPGTKLSYGKGL